MNAIPLFLLLMPILGCVLIGFNFPAKRTALTISILNLFLGLMLAVQFPVGSAGYHFETNVPWVSFPDLFSIRFHLGVDGINLPLVLLSLVVSVAAIAVAQEDIKRAKEFFICLLVVSLGAIGAFLSLDLFFLYIFHEFALIPTFLLIGIWGSHNRKYAAWQITLYLTAGSLILLAGLLAFYFALPDAYRSFDLSVISTAFENGSFTEFGQAIIYGLLLVGFGILISLWPFHTWAPQGYASAPVSAAMLHAGVLKKFGLYGLLRIAIPFLPVGLTTPLVVPVPFTGLEVAFTLEHLLLVMLTCNILYVGLVTIAQKDLSLTLGYSSVMHMGYLFLALASANQIALSGMIILMVAHGLSTALLFGLSGEIKSRTGTLVLGEMGGLASRTPALTLLFMIGAFASIGLPGLANFSGEILIFFGGWQAHPVTTFLALWGVVISAVYMLRAARSIFFGEQADTVKDARDFTGLDQSWPYVMLVICLFIIGFYPALLTKWFEAPLTKLLGL